MRQPVLVHVKLDSSLSMEFVNLAMLPNSSTMALNALIPVHQALTLKLKSAQHAPLNVVNVRPPHLAQYAPKDIISMETNVQLPAP
jgi:hypothetical protein